MGIQNTTPKANPAWIFTVPPAKGWTRAGISLPPRGGNALQIVVTSCGGAGLHPSGAYCAVSNDGAEPASPCPGVPLPLRAYDSCGAPAGGGGLLAGAGAMAGAVVGGVVAAVLLGAALAWRAAAARGGAGGKSVSLRAPPSARRAPAVVRAVISHTLPAPLRERSARGVHVAKPL